MSAIAGLSLADLLASAGASTPPEWAASTWSDRRFPGALVPVPDGDGLTVYALAATQADWRRLRPLLSAFVGRSFSDFSGQSHELDPRDPLESRLATPGIAVVVRLRSEAGKTLEAATAALVRGVLGAKQTASRRMEPTSVLLARFHVQVDDGDREAATHTLDEIRAGLRVDSLNLGFLEVALHARLRDWRSLRAMPDFETLCRARRSRQATAALLEALYWTEIAPNEEATAEELVERYTTSVQALAAGLTADLEAFDDASVGCLRLRALEAAATGVPWEMPDTARDRLGDQFAAMVPSPGKAEDLPLVAEPEVTASSTPAVLDLLVAADQSDSLELLRTALDAWDELSDESRAEWERKPWMAPLVRDLRGRAGGSSPPTDWLQWLNRLDEPDFEAAVPLARTGAEQWPTTVLNDETERAALVAAVDAVDRRSQTAQSRLENALIYLVSWLRRDENYPRDSVTALYEQLLYRLAAAARTNHDVVSAAEDLVEAVLASAPTAGQYRSTVGVCRDLLEDYLSPATADAVLSLFECMLRHPCADEPERQNAWAWLSAKLMAIRAQLDTPQLRLIASFEKSVLGPEADSEWTAAAEANVLAKLLDGKTVAIYTLTPGAGQQARTVIAACAPTAKVILRQDKVCTQQLKEAARTSDFFVVATRSAKHAATDCIHAARGDLNLLYARGRGASSIVAALQAGVNAM